MKRPMTQQKVFQKVKYANEDKGGYGGYLSNNTNENEMQEPQYTEE